MQIDTCTSAEWCQIFIGGMMSILIYGSFMVFSDTEN